MSFLSMMEAELPPGFRFYPRDDELVCDYLAAMKASEGGNRGLHGRPVMMIDVDLNKVEPWDLPETARVGGKEWYFFSMPDRKYATGQRTNRATISGYWKATGKDRVIRRRGVVVGMRKTLVFYQGRAPKGKKTEWVMHEFRMEGGRAGGSGSIHHHHHPTLSLKEDWVLCRVFYKSRGIFTKPCSDVAEADDAGASCLPPLMDTYISFEQQPLPSLEGTEQVPCFSNLQHRNCSSNITLLPSAAHNYNQNIMQNILETTSGHNQNQYLHGFSELMMNSYVNQFSCDKRTLKSVLDQLTKMDANQKIPSEIAGNYPQIIVTDGSSSESYLSNLTEAAAGLPSMWNTY